MTIRAILRDGRIQPVDPLPAVWAEGQELLVEEPQLPASEAEINAWEKELADAAAQVPSEEHERFRHALEDVERESKEAIRKEWEQS
jgi:hypothetical protein